MTPLSEAEIQVLIVLIELAQPKETPNNNFYTFYPQTIEEAAGYFRGQRVDWAEGYESLEARGWISEERGGWRLTPAGIQAADEVRDSRPPIYYWYEEFYASAPASPAYAGFCARTYGLDLCQSGFSDMAQLDQAIEQSRLGPGERALDLGCGAGHVAEYLSDRTRARVWGVDYSPRAIREALRRTRAKRDRLVFQTGNLDSLDLPEGFFDLMLSVDTLYMPNDLEKTLKKMARLLRPGGRMALFYSHSIWDAPARRDALLAESTPLGIALRRCGLGFRTLDFSEATYRLMQRKRQTGEALREAFH